LPLAPFCGEIDEDLRQEDMMTSQTKSVLIVDDNFTVRAALRAFVERTMGLLVCASAANGADAIEKASEHKPDLVLMDLSMPVMNGLDAAGAIKKAAPNARIVVFTLYSDTLGKLLASAAGVDLVVSKADGPAGLLHGLETLFGQSFSSPALAETHLSTKECTARAAD
jgi:DNA-binding NarL/FixJ family response regulator